jgi:hypothetical protein
VYSLENDLPSTVWRTAPLHCGNLHYIQKDHLEGGSLTSCSCGFSGRGIHDQSVQDLNEWNVGLSEINAHLGHKKQVNMIVVLTNQPSDWYYALEEAWIGGKKNDAILVIGVSPDKKPTWARVMAWTTDKLFEVRLRDAIMALPEISSQSVLPVLSDMVDSAYKRKPMAEFEYLKATITPTSGQLTLAICISLILAGIMAFILHSKNV